MTAKGDGKKTHPDGYRKKERERWRQTDKESGINTRGRKSETTGRARERERYTEREIEMYIETGGKRSK